MAFTDTPPSFLALVPSLLILSMPALVQGGVLFSSLRQILVVSASLNNQTSFHGARAGIDQLHVSWLPNMCADPGVDASFKAVKLKLCFAPHSQLGRGWRTTHDDLHKDKTCQFDIASQLFHPAGNSTTWTVAENVPGASYFVRAYAVDAADREVAFGQTTDKNKTANLFIVKPISGRHASLDIAASCFSALSVISLVAFFFVEKKLTRHQLLK